MKGLIRPWYRSRLFWLGVPGLVFLAWAWVDSMREEVTATHLTAGRSIVLGSIGGLVKIEVYDSEDDFGQLPTISTNRMNVSGYVRDMENPGNGGDEDVFRYVHPTTRSRFELVHPIQWFQLPVASGKNRTDWPISPWSLRLAYWLIVIVYLTIWLSMVALIKRHKSPR